MPNKFKVVISGMSGRFPECEDVCTFKEKLYNGDEFVTTDDRKWPVGYKYKLGEKIIPDPVGKLSNIHKLDYTVFKINTTFALSYDIINRLALEPAFEAVVDAGINPYLLDGNNVGVFMSTGLSDVESNIFNPNLKSNILALIGCNKTMLSNRVSFALNLTGPSFTNHVDMHGGLESLAMGYKYVSEGYVEAAIVGVAASIVDPRISLQYVSLGILCSDGVTRPFDEWANGYARSEGVVCFYLQRAEDAKRNYGEIKVCDFHYEGSKLPNYIGFDEEYLKTALQHLYDVNNFSPNSANLGYVEMNAYGHKIMDKVESNAVAEVLAKSRNTPLMVGSIKSNVGHTEASAGFMSVLKGLFALETSNVAPNKHLKKLNDDIAAFKQGRMQVVTEKKSLPGNTIAVNSIGLFGSVGLAVIEQHEKSSRTESHPEEFPRLLLICGRKENDLKDKLLQIEKLPYNPDFIALTNDALGQHMPLHIYRGFTLLPTLLQPVHDIKERGEPSRPVWFIFSGMGSQWNGMGKSLLKLPLFAETVAKCDKVLREKNIDIYRILVSDDPELFDDIMNAFVGIITVQIGLYEVVKALGIKPDGIIGHSVGENGCAYADGCLSLEQAVLASWARGVASTEVETIKGMMAAVGKGYNETKYILPDDIQVACHNSADSCTLTGPAESVNDFVQKLQKEGVFAKAVNVANIAYHSKYIAAAGPKLLHRLKQVISEPKQRSSKWISTSVAESEWDTPTAQYCSAEYLTNNLLSPVLFEEGCKHIPANAICIEFAPHGLLQAILKRSLPDTCTNVPLTFRSKGENNLQFTLSAIGRLYIAGLEPQVNNIFPSVEYPVPRGTPSISPYCTWYHQEDPVPYHLVAHDESNISGQRIRISIREDSEYAYLKDHKMYGSATVPPSFFMYLAWWILSFKRMENVGSSSVVFENISIHKQVTIELQESKYVSVMVQNGSGDFEVISRDFENKESFDLIATGRIYIMTENVKILPDKPINRNKHVIPKTQFYNAFEHAGYRLGKYFALVNDLIRQDSEYEANVTWNENWVTFLDALMKVQMFAENRENVDKIFPNRLRRLEITAAKFLSLEKGALLPCKANVLTRQLTCEGIALYDLKYKSFSKISKRLNKLRFVPYKNPRCQNISEFFDLCLQIAVENLPTFGGNSNKLVVVDVTKKYSEILNQLSKEECYQSVIVLRSSKEPLSADECVLIITDDGKELEQLSATTDNLLILTVSPFIFNKDIRAGQLFVEVTKQSFSDNTIALLKKKYNISKQKSLTFIDNHNGQTKNKIRGTVDKTDPYFIIRDNIEYADISKLVTMNKKHSYARYLYIMDEMRNKQKLDEMLTKQMEFNLHISVLKQEEWGSYRNLSSKTWQKNGIENVISSSNFSQESLKMEYICLNNAPELDNTSSKKIFGFGYVTLTNDKEKIIGLAKGTPYAEGSECDPYLYWSVPSKWNSKDAVTVAYIYSQAYRLLLPICSSNGASTIMINIGCEYLLAEAFIVLSLYRNLKVFITVDTDEEEALIKHRFPKIPSSHILRCHNCSYEIQIGVQTKGRGVDLVVNCLSGIHYVDASLRCLAFNGVLFEVGTHNCLESNNIGLYTFLFSISLHNTQNAVSDLLKLPAEMKKTMKDFIDKCIKQGVIVPLKFNTSSTLLSSIKTIKCYSSREIQSTSRTLKYDSKHSYIVVGTGMKDGSWFKLIDWLIAQGARKFMIVLEKCGLLSRTEHQISRLLAERNVRILLTSASKLENKQDACSLVKETEKLAPLEAVFFVSVVKNTKKVAGRKVSNLDYIVSPDVHFIGLSSAGLKEFEHRQSRSSPAILIHCDKSEDVLAVLPRLNELLTQNDNNNAEVLYQVTDSISNSITEIKVTHPSLHDYLPHNIEVLSRIGQEEIQELTFIEMSSLSRRYAYCKGVNPIFALPAIHRIILKPLFQRLVYPVFCATAASIHSIKETAHTLYQSLIEIQPSGPVTLISETWTLPLAFEIISYAQLANRKYKIFVLEGNPENWSNQIRRLQSSCPEERSATYADEIFHFDDKIKKEKYHSNGSISFESRVKMYAKNAACNARTIGQVLRAAKMIKDKINEVAPVKFTDGLLKNVILFERYRPHDRVFNLSINSEMVVLNEPNYRSLLNNHEVSKTINENAEFSWWGCTHLNDTQ